MYIFFLFLKKDIANIGDIEYRRVSSKMCVSSTFIIADGIRN